MSRVFFNGKALTDIRHGFFFGGLGKWGGGGVIFVQGFFGFC